MIKGFKIFEKDHYDIDPYDEEIWTELTMEEMIERVTNYVFFIIWGKKELIVDYKYRPDQYRFCSEISKKTTRIFIDEYNKYGNGYNDKLNKWIIKDEFYDRWSVFFNNPEKNQSPMFKLKIYFDDHSSTYIYFYISDYKYLGSLISYDDIASQFTNKIRNKENKYDLNFFINALNIDNI